MRSGSKAILERVQDLRLVDVVLALETAWVGSDLTGLSDWFVLPTPNPGKRLLSLADNKGEQLSRKLTG